MKPLSPKKSSASTGTAVIKSVSQKTIKTQSSRASGKTVTGKKAETKKKGKENEVVESMTSEY